MYSINMNNIRPQKLTTIINTTDSLRNIQHKAIIISKLNRVVIPLLPVKLRSHCRVANYRQHQLILEVENASWLALLRYEQSALLTLLQQDILPTLAKIVIYINPAIAIASSFEKQPIIDINKRHKISKNSALLLHELAEKSDNIKLKKSFNLLANHAKSEFN